MNILYINQNIKYIKAYIILYAVVIAKYALI